MALWSGLLKKFGGSLGEEYYITLTNAICCTFKQLAAMPLSTKRILWQSYLFYTVFLILTLSACQKPQVAFLCYVLNKNGTCNVKYIALSWLKTLHGYPNAIYKNLGTSVHADLMVWGEINLLNKGGLKMNLAFLISFMTFHFYLNLAFHTNIFTIRIVIVIYFNLKKNID